MNPNSISELFAADPTDWTDADIDRIIRHVRERRIEFDSKPEKKAAEKLPKEDISNLDGEGLLSKLGFDLDGAL